MIIKLYLLVLSILLSFFGKSQISTPEFYENNLQNIFANLEKNRIPTGLLLDAGIEFTNFEKFDGTLPDSSYASSN